MTWLSRVSSRLAAMLSIDICVRSNANAAILGPKNQPPRKAAKRIFAFAGALVLVAIAGGASRAQQVPAPASGPMGDVFENNSNSPVYENQGSESCDSSNHTTPYVDGYNAALCLKRQLDPGYTQCAPIGGGETFLAGQSGDFCYYCQQPPMGLTGPAIVIPANGGGGVTGPNYGYTCTANPADPLCYLSCFGKFQYTPPPGTAQMGQDGVPPSVPPSPAPTKFQLEISNTPDPCYPAGPKNYWVCDYPNLPRPPGCTCSTTPAQPPQAAQTPAPKPPSQPSAQSTGSGPDQGNYLLGLLGGLNNCAQGIGSIMGGIGYFMEGDFTDAATMWGLEPGQSVMLKTISAEMSTPVVGSSVTPYQQGVAAGQRICSYILIPAAGKAVGSALGGKPAPTTLKQAIKEGAPAGTGPGSSQQDPIMGDQLKEALAVDEKGNAPAKALEGQWVELQNGPEQLGPYRAQGGLAAVYNKGANQVMKIAKSGPNGYYNDSIKGQVNGAKILKSLDVETPDLSDYQPGSADVPGSVVADDLATKYPGAFELTAKKFQSMTPVQQQAILDAVDTEMNKVSGGDYALLDTNPSNISVQPIGNAFKAIIHDADFLMTMDEIDAEVAADDAAVKANNLAAKDPNNTAPPKPRSLPLGVLEGSLQLDGISMYVKGAYANAQELMQTLNKIRIDRLNAPLESPAAGGAPAPVNPGSGTLPVGGPK